MDTLCRIRDIYRAISEFEERFLSDYGISLNEALLLCCISRGEECCSGEIAGKLGLSASNSSKVIAAAEKKGLVRRVIGDNDKRRMFFSLTDSGRERLGSITCDTKIIEEALDKIKAL